MTMRVNLIHSKLIFFKKIQKLNTLEKKRVHLHRARKYRISKSSYELLCKIHVQNMKLHGPTKIKLYF